MTKPQFSTRVVAEQVLSLANNDELLALTRVFDSEATSAVGAAELTAKISAAGGHSVSNWLRSQGVPYTEVLHDVAKTLKVAEVEPLDAITSSGLTIAEMERRESDPIVSADVTRSWRPHISAYVLRHEHSVLRKFMADTYERMSPTQKAEVDRKVADIARELPGTRAKGLTASAAFLLVANAGGFATYTLMSSVISTVAVGGAPFVVYTSAASMLHFLLGPLGWAALGAAAIYKLGGPNDQQCVKSVLAVAMLRSRIEAAVHEVTRKQ